MKTEEKQDIHSKCIAHNFIANTNHLYCKYVKNFILRDATTYFTLVLLQVFRFLKFLSKVFF